MRSAVETAVLSLPTTANVAVTPPPETPTKKARWEDDVFTFRQREESEPADHKLDDEIRDYLRDKEADYRKLWNQPKWAESKMRKVAERIFSIPATSAAVERVFSKSALLMAPLRSRTSETNLQNLTFLRSNMSLIDAPQKK